MNQKKIDDILTEPYWPPNLKPDTMYVTTHDDNDGDPLSGMISVHFTPDGDAWLQTLGTRTLRFRTWGGGGKFLRIRNALLLLADAIRQEGDDGDRTPH